MVWFLITFQWFLFTGRTFWQLTFAFTFVLFMLCFPIFYVYLKVLRLLESENICYGDVLSIAGLKVNWLA